MPDLTRSIEGTDKTAVKPESAAPAANIDPVALLKEGQANIPNQFSKPAEPAALVVPAKIDGLKSNDSAASAPDSDARVPMAASKTSNTHGVGKGEDPISLEIGKANEAAYRKDLLDRYGGAKGLAAAQKKDMQLYDKFSREQAAQMKRDHVGEF